MDAPVFWMDSILVRAIAPETSGNLIENVPPKPQHSSAAPISGQRETLNLGQEFSWAVLDAQLPQSVATVVIGDDAIESRADIFDARSFEQKPRKFPNAGLQRMGLGE